MLLTVYENTVPGMTTIFPVIRDIINDENERFLTANILDYAKQFNVIIFNTPLINTSLN